MALTDTQRRSLTRKAASDTLEVEHLLKVAATGDATDAAFLRDLKAEYEWSDTGWVGRSRVVPLGCWVDTVCCFLEQSYGGLVRMVSESSETADFCISVLEEIKTPESVSALLALGGQVIDRPEMDVRLATRLANGFNLLLSFKDSPVIDADVERRVREFLHRLLALGLTEAQRASVVCALRGIGDAESVALVGQLPPFRGSWAGLGQAAVRQIKQRLRRRNDR
jgi:hypothetical protein